MTERGRYGNPPHTGTPSVVPPVQSVSSQKPVRKFLTPRSVESPRTDVRYIRKLIVMLVFPAAYRKLQEKVATGSARLPPASSARKLLAAPSLRQKLTKPAGRGFFNCQA